MNDPIPLVELLRSIEENPSHYFIGVAARACGDAASQIANLREQLAAAERDTKRLDWLASLSEDDEAWGDWWESIHNWEGDWLRAAIDASEAREGEPSET